MYWKVGKKSPVHLVSATLCLLHRPHIISLSSSVLCAPASLVSVCVQIFSSYEDTSWVVLGSS